MTKERVIELLKNCIILMDTEFFQVMTLNAKINFIKEEFGFTDEEIEELNLIEECLK